MESAFEISIWDCENDFECFLISALPSGVRHIPPVLALEI
jgi:hypothetical protein